MNAKKQKWIYTEHLEILVLWTHSKKSNFSHFDPVEGKAEIVTCHVLCYKEYEQNKKKTSWARYWYHDIIHILTELIIENCKYFQSQFRIPKMIC